LFVHIFFNSKKPEKGYFQECLSSNTASRTIREWREYEEPVTPVAMGFLRIPAGTGFPARLIRWRGKRYELFISCPRHTTIDEPGPKKTRMHLVAP